MSRIRTYTRNLAANWVGHGANLVVAFLLTPFIVHSLGDVRYGIWSLVLSVVGYMGLADLGVRPSVGRYVNLYLGKEQPEKVNEVVNTALAFFLASGLALVVASGVLGWAFADLFPKVPADYLLEIRVVLLVLALSLLLGFLSSTVWCLVTAYERFDLFNGMSVGVLAFRTAGIVLVLLRGGGLIGLALVTLGGEIVGLALAVLAAKRVCSFLRFRWHLASRARLKELVGFGIAMLVNAISQRVIYFTSLLIVGWFLDTAEVTYFALGLMLAQHGRGLLGEVIRTMSPEILKQGGREDPAAVRWLTVRGTRVVMFFTLPLMVGFIALGREFMVVWMGNAAYARSGTVLMILALGQIVAMSAEVWRNMLSSIGHVWYVAGLGLVEAALSLVLGVAFAWLLGWGINGVALGTLLPSVVFLGLVLPLVGCRLIGLRFKSFLWATTLRWMAAAVLAFAVGLGVALTPLPVGWAGIGAKIAVSGTASLLLGWMLVLNSDDRGPIRHGLQAGLARLGLRGAGIPKAPGVPPATGECGE